MIKISFAYVSQNAHIKSEVLRLGTVTIMSLEAIPVIINFWLIKNPYWPHFGTSYCWALKVSSSRFWALRVSSGP